MDISRLSTQNTAALVLRPGNPNTTNTMDDPHLNQHQELALRPAATYSTTSLTHTTNPTSDSTQPTTVASSSSSSQSPPPIFTFTSLPAIIAPPPIPLNATQQEIEAAFTAQYPLMCPLCKKTLTTLLLTQKHTISCRAKRARNLAKMQNRTKTSHIKPLLACSIPSCPSTFTLARDRKRHVAEAHPRAVVPHVRYECEDCGFRFAPTSGPLKVWQHRGNRVCRQRIEEQRRKRMDGVRWDEDEFGDGGGERRTGASTAAEVEREIEGVPLIYNDADAQRALRHQDYDDIEAEVEAALVDEMLERSQRALDTLDTDPATALPL